MFFLLEEKSGIQPITDIESLSLAQVGNKGYRCCKLSLRGYPVPRSLILPASVYQNHMKHIGLQGEVGLALENSNALDTMEAIRTRIHSTSLETHVLRGIQDFLSTSDKAVSVRSSTPLEDTDTCSSAGLFATTLNCIEIKGIEEAILECWSSLWTPRALKYARSQSNAFMSTMAVVIMEMVDAIASGVLFTANPITGIDEFVIEAIWGLGTGIVSGELTPDRIILDAHGKILSIQVACKPCKFVAGKNRISKVQVSPDKQESSALTGETASKLWRIAKNLSNQFDKALDVEWAVDTSGGVWVLQCRDITTNTVPLPAFSPPGSGEWKIVDHITHPGTRYFSEYYYVPMENGWNEEAHRIGTVNRVKIREVNGFMYYQMRLVSLNEVGVDIRHLGEDFWIKKRFLSELQTWDESVKPASIGQLLALQGTELATLSQGSLIEHLRHCLEITKQMVNTHHRFTYTSFIPIGDFVRQVCEWTGKGPAEILEAVSLSDPSRLTVAQNHPVVQELLEALKFNIEAIYLITLVDIEPQNIDRILKELLQIDDAIARGLRYLSEYFGFQIISGYDVTSATFNERPDILLKSLKSMFDACFDKQSHSCCENEMLQLRSRIPTEKEHLFDEMLNDIRRMKRLRNERGVYSDLWAIGILRHSILEAGRRLVGRGLLDTPGLALEASPLELTHLLKGNSAISSRQLFGRLQYRTSYSVVDAPNSLGVSSMQLPNIATLPPPLVRTMLGLFTAVSLAVDPVLQQGEQDRKDQGVLIGIPASRGVTEGIARVMNANTLANDVNRGDILVVHQTTAALSVLFPMINGIVSEYGGLLSHPAILAREYGIPAVAGCSGVMERIRTGMQLRLDGTKGTIEIIATNANIADQLETLKCDYRGPMQGRDRHRVLNHVGAVRKRLQLIEEIRHNAQYEATLARHFYDEISTEQTHSIIGTRLNEKTIESFAQRHHIEFHPTDACNLSCSGCTYRHDTTSRPSPVSFPFEQIARICSVIKPNAVTLVGGGEPTLYKSGIHRLGDLVCALGKGDFGLALSIGLITNGIVWPPGDPDWHHYVQWIRFSLDASEPISYLRYKGKDVFDKVVNNVFRALTQTAISQVGVGFLYHPGNINEATTAISLFASRCKDLCPSELHRLNIQFRPWRPPTGCPSIAQCILSKNDASKATSSLLQMVGHDDYLRRFVQNNTNIAVNLICRGARENAKPFSECYFGLAKTVIRADGSLFPCFRVAAENNPLFYCGNILEDSSSRISLKELHVAITTRQQMCFQEHEQCLFCAFNNLLEDGVLGGLCANAELAGEYFF